MRTVTVDDDPHLLALTARAAVSRNRATTLPDVQLTRSGVLTEAGHLAAYSRVCGFDLTGVLPSTYLHVLAFPLQVTLMGRPDFPLALPGLVHIANRPRAASSRPRRGAVGPRRARAKGCARTPAASRST